MNLFRIKKSDEKKRSEYITFMISWIIALMFLIPLMLFLIWDYIVVELVNILSPLGYWGMFIYYLPIYLISILKFLDEEIGGSIYQIRYFGLLLLIPLAFYLTWDYILVDVTIFNPIGYDKAFYLCIPLVILILIRDIKHEIRKEN